MERAIAVLVVAGVFFLIFRDLLTWELVKWLLWLLLFVVLYVLVIGGLGVAEERRLERKQQEEWSKLITSIRRARRH